MSANNPQNSPFVIAVNLLSVAADALMPAFKTPRRCVITKVQIANGADIAASNTDYVKLQLKAGSTLLAEYDSRAANEGALVANVSKDFGLDAAAVQAGFRSAALVVEANTDLTLNYDETDAGTNVAITNGVVSIVGYWL